MTSRFAQPQPTRRFEMGWAFTFGCVALATVLWLAFRAETLNEQQFEILRIVLALAGGGIGAVIPGFLDVSVKASTKLALRAGGALAAAVGPRRTDAGCRTHTSFRRSQGGPESFGRAFSEPPRGLSAGQEANRTARSANARDEHGVVSMVTIGAENILVPVVWRRPTSSCSGTRSTWTQP